MSICVRFLNPRPASVDLKRCPTLNMPLEPSWPDIAVRLVLTILAGAVIGFNRGARGHAAGFRTTILVGLAASVVMSQANVLLPLSGKTSESFAVMDLMRLPLGILTGVGFIGGGTILKKGDLVTGVTTAAALWLMTVIGLCLGGGRLILGTITTVLGVLTLSVLSGSTSSSRASTGRSLRSPVPRTGMRWRIYPDWSTQ
jgi:putative Mg2+ transporter-C (MgtC) family protein